MDNATITGNARKATGLKQEEFAALAGISTSTYQTHERRPGQHRVDELRDIADNIGSVPRLLMAEALVKYVFGSEFKISYQ